MGKKGGKKKAEVVFLVCEETGDHNYSEKIKALQYYIDHKLPLKPGAPQP